MRIPHSLFVAILSTATVLTAHAQAASDAVKVPTRTSKLPSGMSFHYDGAQKQIVASGVSLKPSVVKSDSVSPTTGTVAITINIRILTRFESGTTYHCSVYVLGGIIDTDTATVDGGLENANNFATITSPTTAVCTLKVPYSWTLPPDNGASSGLIIAFGAAAVNSQSEVEHSTVQLDGVENLPANGATSKFAFTVAL